MVIVSDTNILSSLAAADALPLLLQLFPDDTIYIPPAVEQELQTALAFGRRHVERVLVALTAGMICRIELTAVERSQMATLPSQLHAGEREGIVLCQARKSLFLTNDRRAIRFCEAQAIQVVDLVVLLRSLQSTVRMIALPCATLGLPLTTNTRSSSFTSMPMRSIARM